MTNAVNYLGGFCCYCEIRLPASPVYADHSLIDSSTYTREIRASKQARSYSTSRSSSACVTKTMLDYSNVSLDVHDMLLLVVCQCNTSVRYCNFPHVYSVLLVLHGAEGAVKAIDFVVAQNLTLYPTQLNAPKEYNIFESDWAAHDTWRPSARLTAIVACHITNVAWGWAIQ